MSRRNRRGVMSEDFKYELAKDLGFYETVQKEGWGGIKAKDAGNMVKRALQIAEQTLKQQAGAQQSQQQPQYQPPYQSMAAPQVQQSFYQQTPAPQPQRVMTLPASPNAQPRSFIPQPRQPQGQAYGQPFMNPIQGNPPYGQPQAGQEFQQYRQ
jgi:hypothetical protein